MHEYATFIMFATLTLVTDVSLIYAC